MSTFERMLQVLGNRDAACHGGSVANVLSRVLAESRSGAGRRARRRASSRRGRRHTDASFTTERLEQRQVLAVTTFAESSINGGWTTIVAESGDNVFLQEVATSPKSIYVADNSSFKNRTVIGGPLNLKENPAVTDQLHIGRDVSTLDTITITTGKKRRDLGLDAQGYPMVAQSATRFTLEDDYFRTYFGNSRQNLSGRFSILQPDPDGEGPLSAVRTYWDFNNDFSDDPRLTNGIGVNQEVKIGQYYPTDVFAVYRDGNGVKGEIEVRWNVAQLPREAEPLLDAVSWYRHVGFTSPGNGQRTETDIRPSAGRNNFISLENATGLGLNPVIASTFSAQIVVDGVSWRVTTGGPSASVNTLYFNGSTTARWRGNTLSMTGVLDTGTREDGFRRGIRLTMSGDYTVELVEANYCVTTGVGDPVSATIFAGQDITAALDVNLLIPGSKFSLDSPVRVDTTRSAGITVRATDVTFNAVATTASQNGLVVGPADASDAQALEVASAVAELSPNGVIQNILVPTGFGGAGYDPQQPPVVTIDRPASVTATAYLSFVSNGYVESVRVTDAGVGYKPTTPPEVRFINGVGVIKSAVATAVLGTATPDGTAGVRSVTVDPTQRGQGYTVPPVVEFRGGGGFGAKAEAIVAGSIPAGGIEFVKRGVGYPANSKIGVTFVSRSGGSGATGYANTDANGSVIDVVVEEGGTGYRPDSTDIQFDKPPEDSGAKRAIAVAKVDETGRVRGFVITDPGTGYGEVPRVTVAAPLPVFSAARAVSDIDNNGGVTGITFESGSGLSARINSVDRNTGAVTSISVFPKNGGTKYVVGDTLSLIYPSDSKSNRAGRGLQVRVAEVAAGGAVSRLDIVSGGARYTAGYDLMDAGGPIKGYGYTKAPTVTIGRPDSPDGVQAVAIAERGTDGSIEGFKILEAGSGYASPPRVWISEVSPRAQAERVTFNTGVGAPYYQLTLADDRSTPAIARTKLLVSNTGALAGFFAGNNPSAAPATGSVVIESHQGDVLVAGQIFANKHSYLMQSDPEDQSLAPFRLSTDASGTGVQTGLIRGGTLAVTLANDLDTVIQKEDAVAVNEVSLLTAIDSLRLRAARRDGRPINDPFPYTSSIQELDDISIDAVAASGFPIYLSSLKDMLFTASLETAAGLVINGVQKFTVTAPVSTSKGRISIEAAAITVSNSLQVTDVQKEEDDSAAAADITLKSTDGDINLKGGSIRSPNKVVINQRKRDPKPLVFSASVAKPILIGSRPVSLSVDVPRGTQTDDINVTLAITHPSLAGLAATLIAPDKTRIALFATKALVGKNLTGTIFDGEATSTVALGTAPFTGRFRPADTDALQRAYSRNPGGTWSVEVVDNGGGDSGTLDAFALTLNNPEGTPTGAVYGSSRIQTGTLVIDADGDVGVPTKLPEESAEQGGFYLGADVKHLSARVEGSFALDNLRALEVLSLRAGKLVSLRANGVDPEIYSADDPVSGKLKGQAKTAALRGVLTDVTQLDVSAPNGSIDLSVKVSETITLGNQSALALAEIQRAGKFRAMSAAGSVTITSASGSTGGDFVVYDAPLAGSSAREVRFAVTLDPSAASYTAGNPGFYASTLRGLAKGVWTQASSPFGGSLTGDELKSLKAGERILIANTAASGLVMNGIYTVVRVGDKDNSWMLIRATDSDTQDELPANAIVAVTEGVKEGTFYRVTYPTGNTKPFGAFDMQMNPVVLPTSITSTDARDEIRFVVSTTDGTNTSPGSLGKMIRLRQANRPAGAPGNAQANAALGKVSKFYFKDSLTQSIRLTQELPKIEKVFTIDGSNRYPENRTKGPDGKEIVIPGPPISIDGSRISTTRTGKPVSANGDVNGIELTSKQDVLDAAPAEGKSAVVKNLLVGGFNQGAAVRVSDFPYTLLDSLVIGVGQRDVRLIDRYGVVITATTDAAAAGASGVVLSNSEIYNSGNAGVSVQGKASGVKIFANTIGSESKDNVIGVEVRTSGIVDIGEEEKKAGNTILSNGTGVLLAGSGKTTVRRSTISGNAQDGILIQGGENIIGLDSTPLPVGPSVEANTITNNGGYGIRIDAATRDEAQKLAVKQKIFRNYFVAVDATKDAVDSLNDKGSIAISFGSNPPTSELPGDSFKPAQGDTVTPDQPYGIDANGNQHLGRGDFKGPTLALALPEGVDGKPVGVLPTKKDEPLTLAGLAAASVKVFVLTLEDTGSGLQLSSLDSSAFVLKRDGIPLTQGVGYLFESKPAVGEEQKDTTTKPVLIRFTIVPGSTFPLGNYSVEVTSDRDGRKVIDGDGNPLDPLIQKYAIDLKGAQPPSGLSAKVAGDGQVQLTWAAPSDNGGSPITSYLVQASTNKGLTWANVVLPVPSTVPSATITGLPSQQEYVFRVAAVTGAGAGAFSEWSQSVTPGLAAPAAPRAVVAGAASVTLAWAAPIGTAVIQSYAVQQSADEGKTWTSSTFTQPVDPSDANLATTVTGLANGSKYLFRVAAVSSVGQGNWSPVSDSVLLLAAPIILSAEGRDSSAVLLWRAPVVTGTLTIDDYLIQRSTDGGTTWLNVTDQVSTATAATVSVSNGTTNVFRVAAKTAQGQGEWSLKSVEVTPLGAASAPLSVRGTPGDSKVDLTWTVPGSNGGAAITDYVIESSSNTGGPWSTVIDGVSAVPAATITRLTNGVSYVFRVTAITSFGRGAASQPSTAVVPLKAASAPLALIAVGGDGGATLSWTVPASNGGAAITDYSIQRSVDSGTTWVDVVDTVTAATGAPVTGLTNGTSYVFRVAARTAAGLGAWTAASAAVVPLKTASAPRSLQVTPGDGSAVLTWLAPESTGGSPVTDYIAQRSSNGGQSWVTVSDSVTETRNMTATALDNGTTYVFRVAAVTSAGPGPWTAASQGAVPRGPATVPLNVQGTAGDGQVVLRWAAPASTGGSTLRDYLVQSSTDGGRSWSTVADGVSANTGATVRGLNNGTNYAFRVAALTDFATGTYSPATAAIVPLTVPGQITGLQAQAGAGRVNLNWQAPANTGGRPVSDYTIEYSVAGTATWVPWARAASTATSATITGLATNNGYLFRVTTVTSFATAQAVATTEAVVPGQPPTMVTGRAANGSVTLAWLPPRAAGPSRITDYRIQYSLDGVNWTTAVDGVSAASRATVRGLANGSSYTFRVAAITAKGVGSYSAVSARLTPRAR